MKKNNKIEIYIAAHKKFEVPKNDIYIPLHVGAFNKADLGFLKDSTKKNISEKNSSFCELTGIYWIWKNVKADIIGLVHYRRYFYNSVFNSKKKILTEKEIKNILNKYDIIVAPKGYTLHTNVKNDYIKNHIEDDFIKCEEIIKNKYPDYMKAYNKIMNGNSYRQFNMIITKKSIFNEYCSWIFDILLELEKNVDLDDGRNNYNKRVFGFLSERLFNVWLLKNNQYKIKEKCVFNTEESMIKQKIRFIIKKIIKG